MTEDNWLTAAISDTSVAAELLLNLRSTTLPPPSNRRRPPLLLQSWTVHQRRSRTQPVHLPSNKSESESPNASPTSPFSWSGNTSVAGVVDDAHSKRNRSDFSRYKVMPPSETTSKRPRKKKSLAALRMEEGVLMKEQDHLKRKLAAVQANYEKQIKEIVRLRKIKLDIRVESQGERPKALRTDHFDVVDEQNDRIVLPDLNVPLGEDLILSY